MSRIATALRLLLKGQFRLLAGSCRRTVLLSLCRTRSIRIGDTKYEMYVSSSSEFNLVEDARELKLLGLVGSGFDCIYDIGANVGLHTIYYSHVAIRVVAFEPHPENYARLCANIALNGRNNIDARPVAVSDRNGELPFFTLPGPASQVNILTDHLDLRRDTFHFQKIFVQTVRLDDLRLPPPNLIKIDVEGAEMNVLRGARACIQKYKPILHVEVHPALLHLFNTSARQIRDFLTELGYSIEVKRKGDEEHYICCVLSKRPTSQKIDHTVCLS